MSALRDDRHAADRDGVTLKCGQNSDAITQEAEGAVAAQTCIDRLREEWTTPDLAWLAFVEVAAKFGWRSPACRAFVHELAKRAAA